MSNVPKLRFKEFSGEYKQNTLNKLTDILRCGIAATPEYVDDGIVFLSSQNVTNDGKFNLDKFNYISEEHYEKISKNAKLLKGDILYSRVGAGYGNATIFPYEGQYGVYVSLTHIRANEKLDNTYLSYMLNSPVCKIQAKKGVFQGGGVPNLNVKIVEKFKINYPSKQEQEKIASFLTSVDTKIEQLTKKEELLSSYKKGVMQKIFSGEIRFKADDGSEFCEWEELTLGKVAKFRRGSFPQPYGLPEWYDDENGKPFVQVFDVDENMKLKISTKNKISKVAESMSVFVPKGNIVLTIQGTIGRIALTQYDAYVDRTLLIFTDYIKEVNKQFFIYIIYLLFDIEKRKAPGGTIKTITKEVLTDFVINLPCLDEQTKIANFLSSIDSKIEQVQKQLNSTKEFKKALLQQMFV